MKTQLGLLAPYVNRRLDWHGQNRTINRLFDHDITLWGGTGAPGEEIANRLDWLGLPTESSTLIPDLEAVYQELLDEGYNTAVLLGMGGSSLAPFVTSSIQQGFSARPSKALQLIVLDSTSPDQIQTVCDSIELPKTVFIISSKSGTTSETKALADFFWQYTVKSGEETPGRHFMAVTDPGSMVVEDSRQKQYRAIFEANPEVGGRFSALTTFGLLPTSLLGINLEDYLGAAQKAAMQCGPSTPAQENPGLFLGTVLAEAASLGMDKAIILADPEVASFGVWAEQLVAESSGKNGVGIIPVAQEPVFSPDTYSPDRVFVYLRSSGRLDPLVETLAESNRPHLTFDFSQVDDLAAQFYIWEVAIAVACTQLGVNAFNQPNVQETKTLTKTKLERLRQTGSLGLPAPQFEDEGIEVRWDNPTGLPLQNLPEIIQAFLAQIQPGDYLAVNAFLPDTVENQQLLTNLRFNITSRTGVVTTSGFGPRYLHSTGQLHKGGKNSGLFLVLTKDSSSQLEIPEEAIQFKQFILAQAAGDIEALTSRGRRVLHIHFKDPHRLPALNELFG